jgi:hypothetical protein
MQQVLRSAKKWVPAPLHPLALTRQAIRLATHRQVIGGPFRGMRYIESGRDREFPTYYPKLLGTYEIEIGSIIEGLCRQPFEYVVNVGAADGFYAVGFARRNPLCQAIAYEMRRQDLIAELAQLNGVSSRVEARGLCTVETLSGDLVRPPATLVLMDVEGAEETLLDPEKLPPLQQAYILVESHDLYVPGIGDTLKRRFENSHHITEVWTRERVEADMPTVPLRLLFRVARRYVKFVLFEGRPAPMRWLYMRPNEA